MTRLKEERRRNGKKGREERRVKYDVVHGSEPFVNFFTIVRCSDTASWSFYYQYFP